MNGPYLCLSELMVNPKMEELKREMDSIRLLHEAELSNPSLFERITMAIGSTLIKLGQRLHKSYTEPHQAYQTTSGKYAA
jgi:hypothetical protein